MPTKVYKAMMTACVVSICLLFAASLSAALHGKAVKFSAAHRSLGNLEQDERILAGDMRKLRRDLRRDASQTQIAIERDKIRRDWINIVVDRSLGGARFSPTLVDLSPYRWFNSKWHWKKSNV